MASEHTQHESIPITLAKGTDIGRSRDHNEDCVDAFSPTDPDQRLQKGELFIVADGMGGHQAGEVASEGAVRVVSHEYYADPTSDVRNSLIRAIKKANAYIHQQAQETISRVGMGTTIVAAVARGKELYLANVGDSRAYLMRNGKINQVTRDHSFVEEQIRLGILTREEARAHPQRNVITRALGSKPEVQVDTYSGELKPGDVLLLCSDGLSEHVQEQEMAAILSEHSPEEAVSRLIALANERGGNDNISVLIARIDSSAPASASQTVPVTQPAKPAAKPAKRKRSSLPLIVGLTAVGLIIVGALAAGIFLAPTLFGGKPPTPTTTPSPEPTITPTLPPTATPRPTSGAPTATPAIALNLQNPLNEATFVPGESINFRWAWNGELPAPFTFIVASDQPEHEEICRTQQGSCIETLDAGVYEWWLELRVGEQTIKESEHRTLYVRVPSTSTSTPTLTPTETPTPTVTPSPSPQPSEGGNDGNGGQGEGGDEPPSRR